MAETADVVVIGGRVIGSSIAFNLAKRGIARPYGAGKQFRASNFPESVSAAGRNRPAALFAGVVRTLAAEHKDKQADISSAR